MGTASIESPSLPDGTTWGRADDEVEVDTRALRRYRGFLRVALVGGEIVNLVLVCALLGAVVWTVTLTNFENDVFTDGSEHSCVLNGSTGEITNAR